MAYMITAECINCSSCAMECPVRAISAAPSQYRVDPMVCIECEGYYPVARCRWVCPVDACVPAREGYLHRAAALAGRGAGPIVITAASPAGSPLQRGG
jgi:ferredoxin